MVLQFLLFICIEMFRLASSGRKIIHFYFYIRKSVLLSPLKMFLSSHIHSSITHLIGFHLPQPPYLFRVPTAKRRRNRTIVSLLEPIAEETLGSTQPEPIQDTPESEPVPVPVINEDLSVSTYISSESPQVADRIKHFNNLWCVKTTMSKQKIAQYFQIKFHAK